MAESRPMAKALFYHIGIPRSGTTLIQRVLGRDERVALFPRNWFNTDRYYDSPAPVPAGPFEGRVGVLSDETLVRQNYCKFSTTMERIARAVPEAHIIITLREQRDWLFSACGQAARAGNGADSPEQWLRTPNGVDLLSIAGYATIYRVLKLFFRTERIHLLFFEDLRRDHERFFDDFYRILGLTFEDRDFVRANAGLAEEAVGVRGVINRLRGLARGGRTWGRGREETIRRAGVRVAPGVRAALRRGAPANEGVWERTSFFRALEEEFRWTNRELRSLTGADLARRGYLI